MHYIHTLHLVYACRSASASSRASAGSARRRRRRLLVSPPRRSEPVAARGCNTDPLLHNENGETAFALLSKERSRRAETRSARRGPSAAAPPRRRGTVRAAPLQAAPRRGGIGPRHLVGRSSSRGACLFARSPHARAQRRHPPRATSRFPSPHLAPHRRPLDVSTSTRPPLLRQAPPLALAPPHRSSYPPRLPRLPCLPRPRHTHASSSRQPIFPISHAMAPRGGVRPKDRTPEQWTNVVSDSAAARARDHPTETRGLGPGGLPKMCMHVRDGSAPCQNRVDNWNTQKGFYGPCSHCEYLVRSLLLSSSSSLGSQH